MIRWESHKQIGWGVPNFLKDVPNFVKDVPTIPKRVLRWGSTANHFFMGPKMKLWILGDNIRVSEEIGWDVPNFMKDVPNFVNDLPRELTPKPFLMGSQMKLWILSDKMGVLEAI